jgi:hypothetical protein
MYCSPNIITHKMIKSRRMRWAGHGARMGAKRNSNRGIGGKAARKETIWLAKKWMDNIKMDLRYIGWDGMDWIDLQYGEQFTALVNMVIYILLK